MGWAPFDRRAKLARVRRAEEAGLVADSIEVRKALMNQVKRGEITLSDAKQRLKGLKRGANRVGKVTREQAYSGYPLPEEGESDALDAGEGN